MNSVRVDDWTVERAIIATNERLFDTLFDLIHNCELLK